MYTHTHTVLAPRGADRQRAKCAALFGLYVHIRQAALTIWLSIHIQHTMYTYMALLVNAACLIYIHTTKPNMII